MRRDLPQRRRDRRAKIGRAYSGAVRHRSIVAPLAAASVSPPLHTSILLRALCASAVKNPRSVGNESHKAPDAVVRGEAERHEEAHSATMTSARHTGETPVPPTLVFSTSLPLAPGSRPLTPRLRQEAHP